MSIQKRYKVLIIITLLLAYFAGYAQAKVNQVIQLDALTQIISIGGLVIGGILAWTQLRTVNKVATLKADVTAKITEVKENFSNDLRTEVKTLQAQVQLSAKELEAKMATKHDIANAATIAKLQNDLIVNQLSGLKEQLLLAAKMKG